jgi:hypothetical protein
MQFIITQFNFVQPPLIFTLWGKYLSQQPILDEPSPSPSINVTKFHTHLQQSENYSSLYFSLYVRRLQTERRRIPGRMVTVIPRY